MKVGSLATGDHVSVCQFEGLHDCFPLLAVLFTGLSIVNFVALQNCRIGYFTTFRPTCTDLQRSVDDVSAPEHEEWLGIRLVRCDPILYEFVEHFVLVHALLRAQWIV